MASASKSQYLPHTSSCTLQSGSCKSLAYTGMDLAPFVGIGLLLLLVGLALAARLRHDSRRDL